MVDGHIVSDVEVRQSLSLCESLVRCPVFSDKNAGILTGVVQKVSQRVVGRGKTIVAQGEAAREFFVIRAGKVQVMTGENVLKTLGPGDFFGEAALLSGEPCASNYVAQDDADLFVLDKDAFQEAVQTSPSFKERLIQAFLQRQA